MENYKRPWKTWFTSDTHWNHANIIKLCNRPFESIEQMNATMIANWNSTVKPEDDVFHLGDFAMGDRSLIPGIFKQLNGNIHLIKGNHDLRKGALEPKLAECGFVFVDDELTVEIEGVRVFMRHVPKMDFTPKTEFSNWWCEPGEAQIHLCGHVHESWSRQGPIINVGVDIHGFKPVSLETLLATPEFKGSSHRGY